MTIFGELLHRSAFDRPEVSLTDPAALEYFGVGDGDAGVPVTERSVLGITAYYRAVTLLASTLAALPLKTYRKQSREIVTAPNVVATPSRHRTPFEFWQTMYANALSHGNMTARKYFNNAGVVIELDPIHPSLITVHEVEPSELAPGGKVYRVRRRIDGRTELLLPHQIFHMPYMSPDGTVGLSPLSMARASLGIGLAAERTASKLYKNGSRLQGILQTDQELKDGQAEDRRKRWQQRTAGPDSAGSVAVLDKNLKYIPIALSPADAQLLESRKFTVTEIARLFGLPPVLLADVEKTTSWGTGIEQQMIGLVQFTLLPWLRAVEQRLTLDVLPGGWTKGVWRAEYSVEGLLRGDSSARARFYHQAITDGWLSRNEVRDRENLETVDGLDEFLAPSNLTLISVDGELVPLSAKGTADADTSDDDTEVDDDAA